MGIAYGAFRATRIVCGIHFELSIAQQDILFRLDRNGAELEAEAKEVHHYKSIPPKMLFNQPFLVYMKKRGTHTPYFAMWVDNAELLGKWKNPLPLK